MKVLISIVIGLLVAGCSGSRKWTAHKKEAKAKATPKAVAADLILANDGKAKAVIVISEAPSSAARKAAKVLSDHLFQISGARLEVLKESELPQNTNYIAIGESALTRKLGVTSKGLGPGGILIRSFPRE